jgi:integrase
VTHVRSFFEWLSGQPGYKSRVRLDDVEYLSLDRKTTFEALEEKIVRFPPLEYVQQLTHSIEPIAEVDRRDRALIALLLLSGMRVMAAATLSVGSFNPDLLEVRQYPSEGVATKRLKATTTYLWRIDPVLVDYVLDWHCYLVKTRLFANTDPLFPCTKVERGKESGLFEYSGVEPVFWRTDGPIRKILRERAELAGLEYFNPHAFRHLTAHLVLPLAKSPEQLQAIKQNFGHKFLATTMDVYGKLMPSRQQEVVAAFDFGASKVGDLDEETVKRVMAGIKQAGFTLDKRA